MELLLIRHGDPDYDMDALTPRGHEEARLLGEYLAGRRIDRIYMSPRGRALLTAGYTLRERNDVACVLPWLAELHGKYAEGKYAWNMSAPEVLAAKPSYTRDDWDKRIEYGPVIEPQAHILWSALDAFLAEHGYARRENRYRVAQHSDEVYAFFCHAGVIHTILAHLLQISLPVAYSQFRISPSAITTLETQEEGSWAGFRLTSFNDLCHLHCASQEAT